MEEFRKLEEKLGVDDEYTEALVSERKKNSPNWARFHTTYLTLFIGCAMAGHLT